MISSPPLASFGSLLPFVLLFVASAACEQTVVSVADVTEVEIAPASITLHVGDRTTVSAVLRESEGRVVTGHAVTWSVEDAEVASITPEGEVEGRGAGSTVIHGTSGGITGTANVSVLSAGGSPPDTPGDPPPGGPPGGSPPDDPPPPSGCDLRDQTIGGDFEIPRDASCTFTDVRIRGDLELKSGATLVATRLRVDGEIEAKGARSLTLVDSRVDDDVEYEKGGSFEVRNSDIEGELKLKDNEGRIRVLDSRIGDDVELEKNRGGPFTISGNTIRGELKCKANDPAPTGGGNTIQKNGKDQCRDF